MKKIALALLLPLAAFAGDQVPLKLELPRPLFVGTPVPTGAIRNLEPADTKHDDLLVPAGTVLLSRDKPVTASDDQPVIGELAFVTDGDKSGTDGSFVEFGPGVQWIQIDLGAPAKLAAVALWHFHSQACVFHDVIVQVSDDPAFKQGVHTLFNNDDDNSAGQGRGKDLAYVETYRGRTIDAQGRTARYVRLYSNGSSSDELNRYCEVEVYGQPAH